MLNSLILILFLSLFSSCNEKQENADADSIKNANFQLSKKKCSDARKALDKYGGDKKAADYLQTLASTDACDAGFSEIKLFADDLDVIDVSRFFNSFTEFSTSNEVELDSFKYERLKRAISVLTDSLTSKATLTEDRIKLYGKRHGNDLSLQASYMILAHLGKWLQVFGNTRDGNKGAGSGPNDCVYSYTDAATLTILAAGDAGSCPAPYNGQGHPGLTSATTAIRDRRICDFIVHLNHLIDILKNADIASNSSLGDYEELSETLEEYSGNINAIPGLSNVLKLYDHKACADFAAGAGNFVFIERFLGVVVELGLQ